MFILYSDLSQFRCGKNIEKRREKKLDTTKIDVMYSPSETHMMSKGFDLSEEDVLFLKDHYIKEKEKLEKQLKEIK